MKGRKHTPEQIVRKLGEADRLLADGHAIADVAKTLEVSEQTFHRWRNQYGGMKADDAKELRDENLRLKRMVADQALDLDPARGGAGKRVSPTRRREAVVRVQQRLGLSQRRACRAVGQHRSTQRHVPRTRDADEPIRRRLRQISKADPRFGYRRAWAVLQREGFGVNRKRVQRLWREEGSRVPLQRVKRRRLGTSTVPAERLVATHRNHVWALDFLFDATSDGRPIKVLSMCDEHTRECVGDRVERSITADDVADVLDRAAAERGQAEFIRCDNGPEFVAIASRDWCRFSGTGASFIEPGQPVAEPLRGALQRARL